MMRRRRRVGGMLFTPLSLPNLELWVDASQMPVVTDGTALSSVTDFSGNARHGTASGGERPLFKIVSGEQRIRFDAVDDVVDYGDFMAGTTGLSIFTVWAPAYANNLSAAIAKHGAYGGGGEWAFRATFATNVRERLQLIRDDIAGRTTLGFTGPAASFGISAVTWAGGEEPTMYANGIQLTVSGGASGWAGKANTGVTAHHVKEGIISGYVNPSGYDLLERLIFSRKVTSGERAAIERYLRRKHFRWQVVCDGNSLTVGADSGTDATNYLPYPSQLGALLSQRAMIYNFGVSGQATTAMTSDAATEIDPLLDTAMSKKVVVCWEGSNDITASSAATAYANIVAYCNARRAAGWKVVVLTVLPRTDGANGATFESRRQTLNTSIRTDWATFADALADVAADSRIGDAGDETDTTYYLGAPVANVHLNNTGAGIVAQIVADAINGIA